MSTSTLLSCTRIDRNRRCQDITHVLLDTTVLRRRRPGDPRRKTPRPRSPTGGGPSTGQRGVQRRAVVEKTGPRGGHRTTGYVDQLRSHDVHERPNPLRPVKIDAALRWDLKIFALRDHCQRRSDSTQSKSKDSRSVCLKPVHSTGRDGNRSRVTGQ